jgi:enamine deaminase RidA (YjgF/YER057c/UK114 family)
MTTSEGELDLSRLLATLEPKLQDGEYVFATLADKAAAAACAVDAIGTFAEAEGITLIVPSGYSGLPAGTACSVVQRMITLTGYVNSSPDFEDQPRVINGATELLVEVFGQAGLCARAAIGCQGLAMNSSVELVMTCQFDGGEVVSALPTPAATPL